MFFPYIKDKIDLNISPHDFFYFLKEFTNSLPEKEPLKFMQKNHHSAVIFSNKIILFRRYNINRGEFRVFTKADTDKKIEVSYKITYTKWFLGVLITSFLFLFAMTFFYLFFSKNLTTEIHVFQNMFFMLNLLFWVILWPVIMNIFYGMILRRLFKTLLLSFEFKHR